MAELLRRRRRLTSFQIIILGFAAVILAGALLLMLPLSARSRTAAPFIEALFTATSAVCVTGLVVQDTAAYWSAFGQGVILILIQIGGLGVITVAASFALLSGRRISLMQRSTMQEAISAPKVGGIVRLTGFVLRATFLFEGIGAVVISVAEGLPMSTCLFENASAVGTVGLTLGITPQLGTLSRCVLIVLMFLGRVGGLTLIYAALSGTQKHLSKLPQERTTVG